MFVVFRGTETKDDMKTDIKSWTQKINIGALKDKGILIHKGFQCTWHTFFYVTSGKEKILTQPSRNPETSCLNVHISQTTGRILV